MNKVLFDYQRIKDDNEDDSLFYMNPRLVHHLDEGFRNRLTKLYKQLLREDSSILDFMSSWVSHLPEEISFKEVIGHGLNDEELRNNKRLDRYWVQNINKLTALPLETNSLDYCLITAGWQYLQYPEEIAAEIKRAVKSGGLIIISFSNRAFWSKSPKIWVENNDINRINYIKAVLISQGWKEPEHIAEETYHSRLFGKLNIKGDPFFSVTAKA